MQFYTLHQASADLGNLIASAVHNHEETAIVSDRGSVILVPQDEFESMRETLRLLGDPRALKALLAGHAQRDERLESDQPTVEQVFYDLQDSRS
jgi:PHD/YefM family antitoxin component YafN of YafNO toxin-antitoxin module